MQHLLSASLPSGPQPLPPARISAGIEASADQAIARLQAALDSGKAAQHFDRMVMLLGGPKDFIANHDKHLPKAPIIRPINADEDGFVQSIRTRDLGIAVIELGGGRRVASDRIDHCVGLSGLKGKGGRVGEEPLCIVHAADEDAFARAAAIVKQAYTIGEAPPPPSSIHARIGA